MIGTATHFRRFCWYKIKKCWEICEANVAQVVSVCREKRLRVSRKVSPCLAKGVSMCRERCLRVSRKVSPCLAKGVSVCLGATTGREPWMPLWLRSCIMTGSCVRSTSFVFRVSLQLQPATSYQLFSYLLEVKCPA